MLTRIAVAAFASLVAVACSSSHSVTCVPSGALTFTVYADTSATPAGMLCKGHPAQLTVTIAWASDGSARVNGTQCDPVHMPPTSPAQNVCELDLHCSGGDYDGLTVLHTDGQSPNDVVVTYQSCQYTGS